MFYEISPFLPFVGLIDVCHSNFVSVLGAHSYLMKRIKNTTFLGCPIHVGKSAVGVVTNIVLNSHYADVD